MRQHVSNLIPKGKGQNIAEFYKNGTRTEGIFSKQAREESKKKHSMIKCDCCSRLVPGVIIETGGVRDEIPLHMPCRVCEKWLAHVEEDNHSEMGGMCFECFKEEIE